MKSNDTIRFHIDRRGRILVENFTGACRELARALVDPRPRKRRGHEAERA